jgi:hypothetical protein
MRSRVSIALLASALGLFLTQVLSAAQALAVSSNGKWAMVYNPAWDADFRAVSPQAISECKAKGGTDPKIVWSQTRNYFYGSRGGKGFPKSGSIRIAHGAIAISDNATGTIVGWSFNHPHKDDQIAIKDYQKKGV